MISFKQFILAEKTFRISTDVDRIYKTFFKEAVIRANKGTIDQSFINKFNNAKHIINTSDERYFKTREIKRASQILPADVYISIGAGHGMTYHAPITNDGTPKIYLDPWSGGALKMLLTHGGVKEASKYVTDKFRSQFISEFTEYRIKGSIEHELSHYLDDMLHNMHIDKTIRKAAELVRSRGTNAGYAFRLGGHDDINFTSLEINAQIHALKQLARKQKPKAYKYFDEWISLNPSVKQVISMTSGKGRNEWLKKLYKRALREKIIPTTMKWRSLS